MTVRETTGAAQLQLKRVVAANGRLKNSIYVDQPKSRLVYPLKKSFVLEQVGAKNCNKVAFETQKLVKVGVNEINCFKFVHKTAVIGEKSKQGSWAKTVVLRENDSSNFDEIHTYSLHLSSVECVDVSADLKYLISVGGEDDGNLIATNLNTRKLVAKTAAQQIRSGRTRLIKFSPNDSHIFVTAGRETVRFWNIDEERANRLDYEESKCSNLKKIISSIEISRDGQTLFCGTESGEIMLFCMHTKILTQLVTKVDSAPLGQISCVSLIERFRGRESLLVCQTTGQCCILDCDLGKAEKKIASVAKFRLEKAFIQSVAHVDESKRVLFLTNKAEFCELDLEKLKTHILSDSHSEQIQSIEFPDLSEELFVVSGGSRISIYHTPTMKIKCKIELPNRTNECLKLTRDGSLIITGWNDGVIRGFTPETGTLYFELQNAHRRRITALEISKDGTQIISGGSEGQVRIWRRRLGGKTPQIPVLENSLNAHRSTVSSIELVESVQRCLTSSEDGTCIIWDTNKWASLKAVFTNAMFRCTLYEPLTLSQIISGTSDGTLTFWNAANGTRIREIKPQTNVSDELGSQGNSLNCIQFVPQTNVERNSETNMAELERLFAEQRFVMAGAERTVKLCAYDDAAVLDESCVHSDYITALGISKFGKYVVSGARDGSVYLFEM